MNEWYVLRSKPNKEALLFGQLEAYGMEAYLPRLRVDPINPRARKERPYFNGYLFVRVDLHAAGFSLLNWMPHSQGLVRFGGVPASVPDELIHTIRRQVARSRIDTPHSFGYQRGDPVAIERGPFAGYTAIFDTTISGTERARVLLSLLHNRQLTVELPTATLRAQRT